MLEKFDKNTNPFKVPENYFEDFNKNIMEQLPDKKTEKAKIVPLWRKIAPWTAIAAALIGVVFYVGLTFNTSSSDENPWGNNYVAANTAEDEMFQYMEEEVIASTYNDMLYDQLGEY